MTVIEATQGGDYSAGDVDLSGLLPGSQNVTFIGPAGRAPPAVGAGGLPPDQLVVYDGAADDLTPITDGNLDPVLVTAYGLRIDATDTVSAGLDLIGGGFGDLIESGTGDDRLDGGGGNDTLQGGAGADSLVGDAGTDAASYADSAEGVIVSLASAAGLGGDAEGDSLSGIENLVGSRQDDVLLGSGGANRLDGADGADVLIGGAGNDVYVVDDAEDLVRERALDGADDVVLAEASWALASGQAVERIIARTGDGLALRGNEVAQLIQGGAGDDTLDGRGGTDRLRGGAGEDRFEFRVAASAANLVKVDDFSHADDTIALDAEAFAALASSGGGAIAPGQFKVIGGASGGVVDADDRLIYNAGTGELTYDANGADAGGKVRFAILTSLPVGVDVTDFILA